MSATPTDAAEGYRVFLEHGGEIQLDEINEHLRGQGFREVSRRMYSHYQKLQRHGYRSYLPINRLDIAVAGEYAWSEDMRARYGEVAQAIPAVAIWRGVERDVQVVSLGSAEAVVLGLQVPSAGTPVVLRLLTTGIERVGRVIRTDRRFGRFNVAFDLHFGVTVAATDAPFRAMLTFELDETGESVAAMADVLLRLDRAVSRAATEPGDLARIGHLRLESPLEILVIGGPAVYGLAKLLLVLAEVRKVWFEGTIAKYEAKEVAMDTPSRRRSAQLEADKRLQAAIEEEEESVDTPILDQLATEALPKGDPGTPERVRLIEVVREVLALPPDIEVEAEGPDDA